MSKWIEVTDVVMAEALRLAANGLERNQTSDFPVALLDGLIEFFREAGGCDHSVGICLCSEEQAAYELELAKVGKRVCPGCGGDGTEWDQAKADEAAAKQSDYADDFAGMVKCTGCDGQGVMVVADIPSAAEVKQAREKLGAP